ncbi:MAG: ChrR family anti-sigma-E factor [Rhabdaerophilum sp.]
MDALLAAFAAGALPKALHALVGAHLELSQESRSYVSALEASLGRSFESNESAPVGHRSERLDAIFALDAAPVRNEGDTPKSLEHFFGKSLDALEFRTILPGVKECRVPTDDGTTAVLYRIRAGKKMPQHTHEGSEYTLVIRGAFSDVTGRYGRGDVAISEEDLDHTPIAEAGEECLCFAVMDAPLRLTGPIGRYFNRFIQH